PASDEGRPITPERSARNGVVHSRLLPDLPGSLALVPEAVQVLELAVGIHRLPEGVVPVGHEVVVAGELFQGAFLHHTSRIVRQIVEKLAPEDEKPPADAADPGRLFTEALNLEARGHAEFAEAARRAHGGHGSYLAVGTM